MFSDNLELNPASSQHSARDDVAVSVRNVGKMYYLYDRPQDRLKQAFLWGRKRLYREFWALRDVSFEVEKGETVGIIGQNGSGKSTLLQIIAGTLKPTTGSVETNGRVTALLELGAGFNPEFTGRENVFMNGAILGISREEMEGRFDDIAAFADIGEFIDQPVKIYSSGMYVRLAFAIAASVDPDILIVDEALAVGDIFFQQRCMSRFRDLTEAGTTVILVTHDMSAASNLCQRVLWLLQGEAADLGPPERVIRRYTAHAFGQPERQAEPAVTSPTLSTQPADGTDTLGPETHIPHIGRRYGDGRAEIIGVGLYNEAREPTDTVYHGERLLLRISFRSLENIPRPHISYALRSRLAEYLASDTTAIHGLTIPSLEPGQIVTVSFLIDLPVIHPGDYTISVGVGDGDTLSAITCDWVDDACALHILGRETVYVQFRFPARCSLERIDTE